MIFHYVEIVFIGQNFFKLILHYLQQTQSLELVSRLLIYKRENEKYCRGRRGAKMRAEHFRKKRPRWFRVGQGMRWLTILALVLALACSVDWFMSQRRHAAIPLQSISSSNTGASAPTDPMRASKSILPLADHEERSKRIVYPYSIIPGGIRSVQELKNAIAKDSVVSAHYATFHLAHARIIRLDRERSMHVSYRLGDQVYWTKRELKLAKGETLITDGVQTARTRCGNLISETIVAPVSPKEPTAQELDTPIDPHYTPGELESDNRFPELDPVLDPIVPPTGGGSSAGGGIIPPIFLPSGPAGPMPYPAVPTPPLVVNTPEPGTATLLLPGLLALLLLLRKRKPKDAPKIVT